MNGRIYDPLLGRFLSADLQIQHPDSLQSYNRYSYVLNNPLTLTDPTGFADDSSGGGILDYLKYVFHLDQTSVTSGQGSSEPSRDPEQNMARDQARAGFDQGVKAVEAGAKVVDTGLDLVPGARAGLDLSQAVTGSDQIGREASRSEGGKNFATQVAVGMALEAGSKPLAEAADKVVSTVAKVIGKDGSAMASAEGAAIKTGLKSEVERLPNERIIAKPETPGKAPIGDDGHPVELHHADQAAGNKSVLQEKTRTDHRLGENFAKNHPNTGDTPSKVDRTEMKKIREDHWKNEHKSGRFDDKPDQDK